MIYRYRYLVDELVVLGGEENYGLGDCEVVEDLGLGIFLFFLAFLGLRKHEDVVGVFVGPGESVQDVPPVLTVVLRQPQFVKLVQDLFRQTRLQTLRVHLIVLISILSYSLYCNFHNYTFKTVSLQNISNDFRIKI